MNILIQRVIRSYDQSTPFVQKSSFFEFTAVNFTGWCLSRLNTRLLSDVLFSKNLLNLFFLFRRYRHGATYLGDSRYQSFYSKQVKGLWIKSSHRKSANDLVVYFIHGSGFTKVSVYMYLEFLFTLLVSLEMQGFKNPAIFAIEYSQQNKFNCQLSEITHGWNYLCEKFSHSKLVLVGDSNGATLSLSFLLHIVQPYSLSVTSCPHQPLAAILISPATCLYTSKTATSSDYMSPNTIHKYSRFYKDDNTSSNDLYHNPGLNKSTTWWSSALPPRGIVLMYGQAEMLSPEIEQLYLTIRQCGKTVKLDGEPGQLHSWPIIMALLGRSRQAKEAGPARIANSLAKMVLW